MICNFCGGPTHPATGCQYGPRTIACYRCTVECWRWVRLHTGKSPRRRPGRPTPGVSFYEAAGATAKTPTA